MVPSDGEGFRAPAIVQHEGDEAATILFRPRVPNPKRCRIKQLLDDAGKVKALAVIRGWEPGDAALCHRCPECDAEGDQCTVLVDYPVKPGEAWNLDTRPVAYQAVASTGPEGTGHSIARA
jgi:hypothetical protein